jgi:glycine/D-amino acid oxidase-like deaminating enzyme
MALFPMIAAACACCASGAASWTCRWTARRSSTRPDRRPLSQRGWCYGGFKATPASGLVFAHLLARDEPHPEAARFRLDRFRRGAMIDEKGQGAQPNLH